MSNLVPPVYIATAAAIAAKPVLGLSSQPQVFNFGSYAVIELTDEQQEEIAAYIIRQIDSEPGAVRVSGMGAVWAKVAAKKYGVWAGALMAGMFGLGRLTKRGRR